MGPLPRALKNLLQAPDFLYAALDKSAYAFLASRDCMRLSESDKLHRKSGGSAHL